MIALLTIQKDEPSFEEFCTWFFDVCGYDEIIFFNDGKPLEMKDDRVHQILVKDIYHGNEQLPKQQFCYNWWLYQNWRTRYSHVAWRDGDERDVYPDGRKIGDLVKDFEGDFALNWCFFTSEEEPDFPKDSLCQRFCHRKRICDRHVKPVLNLMLDRRTYPDMQAASINPHCMHSLLFKKALPWENVFHEECSGPWNDHLYSPSDGKPFIAHFYSQTKEDFSRKRQRGRPDCHLNDPHQFNDPFMDEELEKLWTERSEGEVFDGGLSARLKQLETT